MTEIPLPGCRHLNLGHHLKAWGILRALHQCATPAHCDPEAEGWWNLQNACFMVRSSKYDTLEKLTEFFADHYQPTPFFSPWNTGSGMDEKKEITFSIVQKSWQLFWKDNRDTILPIIAESRNIANESPWSSLDEKGIKLTLSVTPPPLKEHSDIEVTIGSSKGKTPKPFIQFRWSQSALSRFLQTLVQHQTELERIIKFNETTKKKLKKPQPSVTFDIQNEHALETFPQIEGVNYEVNVKESGKKAVMAVLAKNPDNSTALNDALQLGRSFFPRFQEEDADERALLEALRDSNPAVNTEAFDSVFTTRASERPQNNPLFLNRGDAGAAEIFRSLWNYFLEVKKHGKILAEQSFNGTSNSTDLSNNGKGSPFFPDAIKTYNNGSGWVVESFPFNALDYVLAVEGAFSLRGSASRTLAANSRRFAAFPFIFETGENMTDDSGDIKDTGKALWLPLWDRPATYTELASFVCDAQSRLPGKEARFSSEFARALRSQGVDAGFSAWQEFRYKMKASRIPWVCTGTYIGQASTDIPLCLTDALSPLDEAAFLNQFNESWKGAKIENSSPHTYREAINSAIDATAASPTPENALEILVQVFKAVKQLTLSESFRKKTHGAHFFKPLPSKPWNKLLEGIDCPEFQIARALASIRGQEEQPDKSNSAAQPMLGSILPLTLMDWGWHLPLPPNEEPSKQAVWTGYDLYHDLSLVLQRRYLDSLSDQLPALCAVHPAPLPAILALLKGELDTHRILRWTEALSLIGWRYGDKSSPAETKETSSTPDETESIWISQPIPSAYAAARSLLEVECEWQGSDPALWQKRRFESAEALGMSVIKGSDPALWQKRRSRIPFALLCQRSPHAVQRSVAECLHWLSVWGVKDPDKTTRNETTRLRGKAIIKPGAINITPEQASRLAATVCVPLDWRDHFSLYREITIPSKEQPKEN